MPKGMGYNKTTSQGSSYGPNTGQTKGRPAKVKGANKKAPKTKSRKMKGY